MNTKYHKIVQEHFLNTKTNLIVNEYLIVNEIDAVVCRTFDEEVANICLLALNK